MQSDWELGLLWYGVFLFSTVLHEAAHAWTALKLGDDTAARVGQVSLNPLPHIRREPFGMVVVPILSWIAGGWLVGWASAPFNREWARNFPRHAALMALAGPAANLLLVVCAAWLIRIGVEWQWFEAPQSINSSRLVVAIQSGWPEIAASGLSVILSLNLLLFVFNLIPLPPLDGSNAPLLLLPPQAAARYAEFLQAPWLRLVGILVAPMHALPQVEAATPTILSMVNFQDGHRYADYNSSTDKTATYGLAALVAGGIAAKVGIFKGFWIAILAFKKIIILALVAMASSIKKFFAWIRGRSVTSTPNPPASP